MSLIETYYNKEERFWHGAENMLFADPKISIGELVFKTLKESPTNICQIIHETGQVVTNAQALTASVSIAQYLKAEGLTHKDIVGVIARNTLHATHLLFACFFNATPFHAVNPHLETAAIANLYAITKPKLIFCDGSDYELLKSLTKNWRPQIITLTEHIENVKTIEEVLEFRNGDNKYAPTKLVFGADQTMGIICSSGTSGLPKAVTLTNSQLLLISPTSGLNDVLFTTASFDWLTAIKALLSSTLNGSTRIVCAKPFSVELLLQIVVRWQLSQCFLSHWQFNELFTSPLATPEALASLQYVMYGGGWVKAGAVQAAQGICQSAQFVCVYGTTETDIIAMCLNSTTEHLVGGLLPGICVRIVNERGDRLEHEEIGEILIKTNRNWNGYYGNVKQSAATLDSDGWFHMGDLGYFDSNNQLYVVDRKKDLLKYKSMHYTPSEIERFIGELAAVQDVCVVGIQDQLYGDAAGALIVRRPQTHLTEQQVIDHVAKRISVDYKQLHAGVRFVDQLPVNFNGKLLRNAAKKMFAETQITKAKL